MGRAERLHQGMAKNEKAKEELHTEQLHQRAAQSRLDQIVLDLERVIVRRR